MVNLLAILMILIFFVLATLSMAAAGYRRDDVPFWDDVPPQMTFLFPSKMQPGGEYIRTAGIVLIITFCVLFIVTIFVNAIYARRDRDRPFRRPPHKTEEQRTDLVPLPGQYKQPPAMQNGHEEVVSRRIGRAI